MARLGLHQDYGLELNWKNQKGKMMVALGVCNISHVRQIMVSQSVFVSLSVCCAVSLTCLFVPPSVSLFGCRPGRELARMTRNDEKMQHKGEGNISHFHQIMVKL